MQLQGNGESKTAGVTSQRTRIFAQTGKGPGAPAVTWTASPMPIVHGRRAQEGE